MKAFEGKQQQSEQTHDSHFVGLVMVPSSRSLVVLSGQLLRPQTRVILNSRNYMESSGNSFGRYPDYKNGWMNEIMVVNGRTRKRFH